MGREKSFTDEQLKEALKSSISINSILPKLGLKQSGGNHELVKRWIKKLNLDTSHILGRKYLLGKVNLFTPKIPLDIILIENSAYTSSYHLKNRLIKEGIFENKCHNICCGINEWLGLKLNLHLDHKNGVSDDNRLENLWLLCPNCHSQTETYGGKNSKTNNKNKNKVVKLNKTKEELVETRFNMRKVKNRPTYDDLIKMIKDNGYAKTGRLYGVSDNAIRRWVKDYEKIKQLC